MANNIFREKSLNKVSSPESLNDYICVVKPAIWAVLAAIVVFIAGICIWASTIRIATDTVKCAAVVKNNEITCYFNQEDRSKVEAGMKLKIADSTYILPETDIKGKKLFEETDKNLIDMLGSGKDYYYYVKFSIDMTNGVYEASIISSDINPWQLLLD